VGPAVYRLVPRHARDLDIAVLATSVVIRVAVSAIRYLGRGFPACFEVDRELQRLRDVSRSSSSGFTLIEVLIALASVSVLVVGAASLLNVASLAIRSARNGTTAALLAQQKIEQLAASSAAPGNGTAQDYLAADGTTVPASFAFFTRRWTVTSLEASSSCLSITVEVLVPGGGRAADVHSVIAAGGASLP
jgi:prepilin-type N-terminal cleavage/methylation domain-containing protein